MYSAADVPTGPLPGRLPIRTSEEFTLTTPKHVHVAQRRAIGGAFWILFAVFAFLLPGSAAADLVAPADLALSRPPQGANASSVPLESELSPEDAAGIFGLSPTAAEQLQGAFVRGWRGPSGDLAVTSAVIALRYTEDAQDVFSALRSVHSVVEDVPGEEAFAYSQPADPEAAAEVGSVIRVRRYLLVDAVRGALAAEGTAAGVRVAQGHLRELRDRLQPFQLIDDALPRPPAGDEAPRPSPMDAEHESAVGSLGAAVAFAALGLVLVVALIAALAVAGHVRWSRELEDQPRA